MNASVLRESRGLADDFGAPVAGGADEAEGGSVGGAAKAEAFFAAFGDDGFEDGGCFFGNIAGAVAGWNDGEDGGVAGGRGGGFDGAGVFAELIFAGELCSGRGLDF